MSRPEDRHMRASDAFSWYMERDPLLRSTVVVVGLLDRAPDPDLLRARIDQATRGAPAFRDRVVLPPLRLARPRWVRVEDLDLTWHLRRVSAAPPGGLTEVLDIARTAATSAFDPARPLWSLTTVEGLQEGRAAFVLAFHHALTDGIGGIELARYVFDLERTGAAPPAMPAPEGEQLDGWHLLWDTARYDAERLARLAWTLPVTTLKASAQLARHPADVVRTAMSVGRTVEPYVTTLSSVMRERRMDRRLDVLDVGLDDLRRAAAVHGGHLNDAFLAAVTGGLRRYHEEHGAAVDDLRVTLPISLRTDVDPEGGNRITLLRFRLPTGTSEPAERMRAIHDIVLRRRGERSLPHTQGIAAALNLLPPGVVGSMLKHVDFLASNVPGVPVPLYVAGAQVQAWYAFGPTIGAAVNCTLMSYVDTCFIGITIDSAAVPDPDCLVRCLAEGFEEVLALAGDHAPVRRQPPAQVTA
jgi:diacylglycerol O-acyltransferase